jgi:hypothetical protein
MAFDNCIESIAAASGLSHEHAARILEEVFELSQHHEEAGAQFPVRRAARDLAAKARGGVGQPLPPGHVLARMPAVDQGPRLVTPLKSVKPSPITPIEGVPNVPRSELAQTGDPMIDAVLNSPITKMVIDNPVVDRSHTVPYWAGGSDPLADPTVYIDHRFPKQVEAPRLSNPAQTVKFDPADPFVIHENVEQHTMEILTKGGMDDKSAYRVAHYEWAEKAEGAWYRANDIDQPAAEALYKKIGEKIGDKPMKAHPFPENLYEKPYPHDDDHLASEPDAIDHHPTADETATAHRIMGGHMGTLLQSEVHAVVAAAKASPSELERQVGELVEQEIVPLFEGGPEGSEQALIPGVAPVTGADRAKLGAAAPLRGGNAPPPEGGLFDDPALRRQQDFMDLLSKTPTADGLKSREDMLEKAPHETVLSKFVGECDPFGA